MVSWQRFIVPLALAGILILSFSLRLSAVFDRSISQDESTMTLFALGVLEKGYPNIQQKTGEFIISTYELVPYPIAGAMALLGKSELAIRTPALLFSSATLLLIFLMGRRFHSTRAGLLAALCFAILPWTTYWGSNGFYPSQLQFFALLTLWVLHEILSREKPDTWLYFAVVVCILLTYLTWEGSGFLLPVFAITGISLTWGRWHWIKPVWAWVAGLLIIVGVVAQLTFRTILRAPFTAMGTDRSQVSFAEPAFDSYGFDPGYYISQLVTAENSFWMVFFVIGLYVLRKRFSCNYLYMVVLVALVMLTGFLGYYALRYVYFLLPAALLLASMTAIELGDRLTEKLSGQRLNTWIRSTAVFGCVAALCVLLASPFGLRLKLPFTEDMSAFELQYQSKGFAFRGIANTVRESLQPGDIVVVQAPFPYMVYSGLPGDYFLQSGTATTIYYHPEAAPYYADKWIQNPVIRDMKELQEVMHRSPRVWFVLVPEGASRTSIGDEMWAYIHANTVIYKEISDGKLLLWQNPAASLLAQSP